MADSGIVAHPDADLERAEFERPQLSGRTLWVGSRVLGACVGFYFLGFVFAYVYLKTLDVNHHWRHGPAAPSVLAGLLTMVLVLTGATAYVAGMRALEREQWQRWRSSTGLSVVGLLAGALVLVVQLVNPGFPYGVSAYASVFVGWSWSLVIVLLAVSYFVAALFAQSLRVPPETRQHAEDLTSPTALLRSAEAVRFVMFVVAGIEVLAWVLLYLVR
jgi:MFS family permease